MWRRIVLALPILLGSIAACTKWVLTQQPLAALPEKGKGIGNLRLHLASGLSVVMQQAQLRNDSVTGYVEETKSHQTFAASDVKSVEVRRPDGVKTSLAVIGGTVAVLAVAGVIAAATLEDGTVNQPSQASCPMVYSWDGSQWLLDSGTFGGAITPGLQRTDVDGLDHLVPMDGVLKLRVTNELDETDHIDALELLVVDHAPGTRIAPDGTGRLHVLRDPVAPVAETDELGSDDCNALPNIDLAS